MGVVMELLYKSLVTMWPTGLPHCGELPHCGKAREPGNEVNMEASWKGV